MRATLMIHIIAGSLGLLSGYLALWATKGARLHRRAGMAFVVTMLAMCAAGVTVTVARDVALATNVPAGVLTAYLVITALTTVRPPAAHARLLHGALMLVALAVGLASLVFAYQALASPDGTRHGMPAFPFLLFGTVGLLAGVGDVRVLRAGPPRGAPRLARHLWRMSFALFIAALSFFLGQADEIPAAIRIPALLALPPLAVLVTMLWWLWRVRGRRAVRGLVVAGAPEAA